MSQTTGAVNEVKGWPYERYHSVIVGESKAHQSHKIECDINRIIKGFRETGYVDHQTVNRLCYGDFTQTKDLLLAYQQIEEAEELFAALPARVRDAAENDPAKFIDLVANPENDEMLRELGLINAIVEDQRPPKATVPNPGVVDTPASGDNPPEGGEGEGE